MRGRAGACATAGDATPPTAAAPSPSAATPPARKLRRSSPGPLAVMVGSQQTQPLSIRRDDVLDMVFPPGLRDFEAAALRRQVRRLGQPRSSSSKALPPCMKVAQDR